MQFSAKKWKMKSKTSNLKKWLSNTFLPRLLLLKAITHQTRQVQGCISAVVHCVCATLVQRHTGSRASRKSDVNIFKSSINVLWRHLGTAESSRGKVPLWSGNLLLEQEKSEKDGRKNYSLHVAISRALGLNIAGSLWLLLKDNLCWKWQVRNFNSTA